MTAGFKGGDVRMDERPVEYQKALDARAAAGVRTETIDRDLKAEILPDAKLVGETLFTRYNLHLQMVGVILLVATVGVIVLSRREDKSAPEQPNRAS